MGTTGHRWQQAKTLSTVLHILGKLKSIAVTAKWLLRGPHSGPEDDNKASTLPILHIGPNSTCEIHPLLPVPRHQEWRRHRQEGAQQKETQGTGPLFLLALEILNSDARKQHQFITVCLLFFFLFYSVSITRNKGAHFPVLYPVPKSPGSHSPLWRHFRRCHSAHPPGLWLHHQHSGCSAAHFCFLTNCKRGGFESLSYFKQWKKLIILIPQNYCIPKSSPDTNQHIGNKARNKPVTGKLSNCYQVKGPLRICVSGLFAGVTGANLHRGSSCGHHSYIFSTMLPLAKPALSHL